MLLLAALGTIATIVSELLIADGMTSLRDWRVIVAVILGGAIIGAIARGAAQIGRSGRGQDRKVFCTNVPNANDTNGRPGKQ